MKTEELTHCVFKNDPIELKKYVQKYVELKTVDGEIHLGTVYTIDPVSESVVLIKQNDGITSMEVIMGHAVQSLNINSSSSETVAEEIFTVESKQISKEELDMQKLTLKNWLCKNRIPIEEDGDVLRLGDVLEIHPPYGDEQCISGNEIILGRVRNLLSTMPSDFVNS